MVKKAVVFLGKVAGVLTFAAGIATAAAHGLPGYESGILTVVGPLVTGVLTYWKDVAKKL